MSHVATHSSLNDSTGNLCNHRIYVKLATSIGLAPYPIQAILDNSDSDHALTVFEKDNDWVNILVGVFDIKKINETNKGCVLSALDSLRDDDDSVYTHAWVVHQKLEPTAPGRFHDKIFQLRINN